MNDKKKKKKQFNLKKNNKNVKNVYIGEYMDFINDPGEEISNGDEGSEDAGHHRRRVHPLLASVLHNVLGARLLPQLYPPHCV